VDTGIRRHDEAERPIRRRFERLGAAWQKRPQFRIDLGIVPDQPGIIPAGVTLDAWHALSPSWRVKARHPRLGRLKQQNTWMLGLRPP
jgi:hypothetical protein